MTATIAHPQSTRPTRSRLLVVSLIVATVAAIVAVIALVSALTADGSTVAPRPAPTTAEAPPSHGLAVDAYINANQAPTPASFTCTRVAFSKC